MCQLRIRRRRIFLSWATVGLFALLIIASGPDRLRLAAAEEVNQGDAKPRRFEFQIQSADGKPVEGAVVTPWAVGSGNGSFPVKEKRVPAVKSDVEGKATIVFPDDAVLAEDKEGTSRLLRDGLNRGLNRIALRVDHPDHPVYFEYLDVAGPRKVELVAATTIVVRVDQRTEPRKIGTLYPVLSRTNWFASDFSTEDGVLTIRRVDRTSAQASQWLRIVEVSDEGPARFSDLIDLNGQRGNPVNLDVPMKLGARLVGRLAGDVPRPVINGRVTAEIVAGPNSWEGWSWTATAEIGRDGKFTLDSLPPDENLQLIAFCDGWVSSSPSVDEVQAYGAEHDFDVQNHVLHPGHVQPRLLRLTSGTIVRGIPMDRTSSCEVEVVDSDGKPVVGASVAFWPNQFWFRGGAQVFGEGVDCISTMRGEIATGKRVDLNEVFSRREQRFSVKTNEQGKALVSNLPPGGSSDSHEERDYSFAVQHDEFDDEMVRLGAKHASVRIAPGETGHATVRLKRK